MKRRNLTLLVVSFAWLASCSPSGNSTPSIPASTPTDTSASSSTSSTGSASSSAASLDIAALLDNYAVSNITFNSDIQFYYYPIGHLDKKAVLQHFDGTAKVTEDAYSFVGKYHGTETVASELELYKDADGDVSSDTLDINNTLVTEKSLNSAGQTYKWEQSIYINWLAHFGVHDFTIVDDQTIALNLDDPEVKENTDYFARMVGNNTSFEAASAIFKLQDGQIASISLKQVESDDVYQGDEEYPDGYMYGSTIDLTIADVDATTIGKLKPFEHSADNDALQSAIDGIRPTTDSETGTDKIVSYTEKIDITPLNLDLTPNGETKTYKQAYVTATDTYAWSILANEQKTYSGFHTDENGDTYTFSTTSLPLTGKKTDTTLIETLPDFSFSSDIFTFTGEKEGIRTYVLPAAFQSVLDHVELGNEIAETYLPSEGNITFEIKDSKLYRISYIGLVPNTTNKSRFEIYFNDIGTTTIPAGTFDDFTVPQIKVTSWADENMKFDLMESVDQGDGQTVDTIFKKDITPQQVFDLALGDQLTIPFFIPENALFSEVSGNVSSEDNATYLNFVFDSGFTAEALTKITSTLTKAGFSDASDVEGGMYDFQFEKLGVDIMLIPDPDTGATMIDMTLPAIAE